MPGRRKSGAGRAARRGMPIAALAAGVLVLALLAGALWWRSHLSGAEGRVRDAIVLHLERDSIAADGPAERALRRFYQRRGDRPAWSDGRRTSEEALACAALLRDAESEGLEAADYADSALADETARLHQPGLSGLLPDPALLADVDLALTRGFLRYARDVRAGRLPAAALDPAWTAARDTLDLARTLRRALDERFEAGFLAGLGPGGEG